VGEVARSNRVTPINRLEVIMMDPQGDYFVIKAKENGVQVIGLTRGQDTRFHHSEKLDKGEVMLAQFTEHTSAVKIRGKAVIMTKYGVMDTTED
jgi:transcription attenuation protein (tryptophan RNA-binding attenuator protein)